MNKITDEEIMNVLKEQKEFLNEKFNEKQCLGLFVYGKANYGFAESIDDIQTVFCYIPTFEELCIKTSPIQIYYIKDNKERQIRVCDIRLLYMLATNQEKIIMEAVFSEYYIINPRYKKVFDKYIYMNREAIFHCNQELRIQKAIENGYIALNNYKKTKNLEELFEASRLRISCRLYMQGNSCQNCINLKRDYHVNYLWQVKHGEIIPEIQEIENDFEEILIEASYFTENENCKDLIKNSVIELMTIALTDMVERKSLKDIFTKNEQKALNIIISNLKDGYEGNISISQLIESVDISRPVFKNTLRKMKDNKIAEINNQGTKGTYVKIIDGELLSNNSLIDK